MNRRDLFKISAGAVAVTAHAQSHRFFTAEEHAVVDELTELIIPADDKSGGARAAKVADYIDARLAEAFEQDERGRWRAGLRPFLKISPDQRLALLTKLAANEKQPSSAGDHFFVALKHDTIRGYYSSKIGIHDDQDYKGNVIQQGDYAGELP
ncbi:MAG TPA: gluconate 2-dehydrogenase subunit 3 family protein [Bryobacteraceae bacterium]|nr:gluconate 2-dehydrogenase subunit 3 family protein [Bryobacteraceae bacterium]